MGEEGEVVEHLEIGDAVLILCSWLSLLAKLSNTETKKIFSHIEFENTYSEDLMVTEEDNQFDESEVEVRPLKDSQNDML